MRRCGAAAGGLAFAAALLLVAEAVPVADPAEAVKIGRCSYQRVGGKKAADCHMKELREVPDTLQTDIEVLDLSYNRIRELYADSFARYTWLVQLYLDDNMLSHVEEGAFDPMQRLQELSLSLTGLQRLPPALLALPSLIALDLSSNRLDADALNTTLSSAPADVSLERLSLASCGLRRLPPGLARLPRLRALNVSSNAFGAAEVASLASLCSLKDLVLPTDAVVERCDCALLGRWTERDGLRVWPETLLECVAGSEAECGAELEAADAARANCRQALAAQESRARTRLLWRAGGGAALVVLALVLASVLYCWCRRRRRKTGPHKLPPRPRSKTFEEDEEGEQMHPRKSSWDDTDRKF